jgi:hypothetical protein
MGSLRIEGLEAAMRVDRLYPVRSAEGYGFYAGQTANGRQLLAAVDARALLVVLFDSNGDLRESHWWQLSGDEDARELLRRRLEWEPALVRVKRFRIPIGPAQARDPLQFALVGEDGFAIVPIPLDWQSDLQEAESLGIEQEDFAAMVQGWVDRGNFALYWGNEYHLDSSGEVVGS